MKKRTCIIGYTKACRRLEQLAVEAERRGQPDQAREIHGVLSGILKAARLRHEISCGRTPTNFLAVLPGSTEPENVSA